MKKKVLFIVLPIVLVVMIVAAVVIGIVLRKNKEEAEEESVVGSKWGDVYYAYLKDAINEDDDANLESTYGLLKDMKDGKIQFCKIEDEENPKMVLTYKDGENTGVNVYQINNEGKVDKKVYKNKAGLRYLYNLETGTYGWYVCEADENGNIFVSMKDIGTSNEISSTVNIEEKETTVKNAENKDVTITEFDKKFIEPEIEKVETFDFSLDMKEKDLEKEMKESVTVVNENKALVSEEQKKAVTDKEKELKEIIKALGDLAEKNKDIAGTWGINTNIKTNSSVIIGLNGVFGSSLKETSNELVLKEDGTFTLYVGVAYNTTGRYKFENNVVSVYEVKDPQVDSKELEKALKFEYIKYNGHEFLKLDVTYMTTDETYIFFEKEPAGHKGYMSDDVPDVKFKTSPATTKTPEANNEAQPSTETQEKKPATSSSNNNSSNNTNNNANTSNNNPSTSGNTSNKPSTITVGSNTITCGTYEGTEIEFDTVESSPKSYDITLKINADGTYTMKSTKPSLNSSGKYRVGDYNGMRDCLIFNEGSYLLGVLGNDLLYVPAGSGTTFVYQGY